MKKMLFSGCFLFMAVFLMGCSDTDNVAKDRMPSTLKTDVSEAEQPTELSNLNKHEDAQDEGEVDKEENLTHEQLLSIAQNNARSVLSNEYNMTLYLEQMPTSSTADFMSQLNSDDINTILISCSMNSSDLSRLDGDAAQKGQHKPYNVSVSFEEYNEIVGLAYTAKCKLN